MIPFNKIFGSLSVAETIHSKFICGSKRKFRKNTLVVERSRNDQKKNQRRVALIFLIRIWILIVRDINFSVTKDKRLFYNLYTSGNFFFR